MKEGEKGRPAARRTDSIAVAMSALLGDLEGQLKDKSSWRELPMWPLGVKMT